MDEGAPAARAEHPIHQGRAGTTEPSPLEPVRALVDVGPVRARFGQLWLAPGASFRPPSNACQDVLVFVRDGTLEATGTGIGSLEAPATLYAGDAARFGPEGDGALTNVGSRTARTIVAFARAKGSGAPGIDVAGLSAVAPRGADTSACAPAARRDALVRPSRVASLATTPPLVVAQGKMRVRILLDSEAHGARFGGLSYLEGDPDVAVPEHRHPNEAEMLFIEDGDGEMRVGDRRVHITPGASVYVPEGVPHDFRGTGARPLRAIQVYAPSGPEQRFRAQAQAAAPGRR